MELIRAQSELEIAIIRELFTEYARALDLDLYFQNFNQELAQLPGQYTPPEGCLLLAFEESKAAGCVALRKQLKDICEMKRLYVRPAFRGRGVGRLLATAIIQAARGAAYERMRLDTLSSMKEAIALYESLGFKPTEPYYVTPREDTLFLELTLAIH